MLPQDNEATQKRREYIREWRRKWRKTEQGKAALKRYNRSEKAKAARARYRTSEKGKATIARAQARQAADPNRKPRVRHRNPEEAARYRREYAARAEVKAHRKAYEVQRQIRKAASGICPRCNRPKVEGKSRCEVHLAYASRWKAKKDGRLPDAPAGTPAP